VVASGPRSLWPHALAASTRAWREEAADVGVVQPNDLHVDIERTADRLDAWMKAYPARVEVEARWLRDRTDLVLADVPPLAFDAAAEAGVPAVALANFSWDWIYERMGLADAATAAAAAYANAALLLELEPAAPMPGFERRVGIGLLGRRSRRTLRETRDDLMIAPGERLVLLAFRAASASVYRLPPELAGIRYALAEGAGYRDGDRHDLVVVPPGLDFIDVLAAADVVVTKPGYGIIGDAAACRTRMLYTDRPGFPEHAVLVEWLESRRATTRIEPERLKSGRWLDALVELLAADDPEMIETGAAQAGASELSRLLGD
jgi:hypothetical protein